MSEGLSQNWCSGPASPGDAARPEGSARTVAELLEYKAPKTGLTPLMVAIQNGHMLVAQQVWMRAMCSAAEHQPFLILHLISSIVVSFQSRHLSPTASLHKGRNS